MFRVLKLNEKGRGTQVSFATFVFRHDPVKKRNVATRCKSNHNKAKNCRDKINKKQFCALINHEL